MARTKITEDQEVSDTIVDANVASNAAIQLSKLGTGNLTLYNQGSTIFKELTANGTDSVTIEAPDDVTTSYTLKLPVAQSSGTQVLQNDGSGNLSWATAPTTPVSVSNGGTGDTSLTAHNVLIGEGTSSVAFAAPGTSGIALVSTGASSDPAFGAVNLASSSSVTGILSNSNTTAVSTATASDIVLRDSNANTQVNNIIQNFATTATAGTTTTLTISSNPLQRFTGTTTQTVKLPDATTLFTGFQFYVMNRSTGTVTVQDNGANTLQAMVGGSQALFTCASVGSANGTWDINYTTAGATTYTAGTGLTLSGTQFSLTNPVSVSLGGTGLATLTAHDVLVGNGTGNITLVSPSTSNFALVSNGTSSDPSFQAIVNSLSATSNQTTVSASTGSVTVGTAQDIGTASSPTFASETLTNTTNQLVLGTTRTVTVSATQPATSSRTYTIPDQGAAANFVLDQANYTISGNWTFSNALTITATTNQLILSGPTRTATISAPQPATSSRTYTFPDLSGNYNVVGDSGTQTIGGSKSFSSAVAVTPTTNQFVLGTTRTVTISATQPATASRTYTIPDQGADANFLMSQAAQTITGQQTLSSALLGADGTVSLPGYSFSADTDAGLYRIGADDIALATNGIKQLEISTTAVTTFLPTAIQGTTTNDSASSGYVGEYIASVVTSGTNAAASGAFKDLTSISLTAGDWDVTFNAEFQFIANTINVWALGISTTTGNSTTGLTEGSNYHFFTYFPNASYDTGGSVPCYRLSLSATTTVYAKIRADYTSTAPMFIGRLSARRMR